MNSKEKKDLTYFRFLPLLLIFLAVLSYGLVIRKLGIYWDDWAYLWTKMELGYAGIVRHFSFSRPLAGQIQNLVMEITGKNPFYIQIYGLSMRVICASLLGLLFHQIWPGQYFAASVCSLLFFIYPGFTMQPIALNFGFSYLLMSILFLSFLLMIRVLHHSNHRFLLTIVALILSTINLFASEYFFMLEFIRPVLIWIDLSNQNLSGREGRKQTFRIEFPYFCILLIGIIYRLFFNKTQTLHYEFSLIDELKISPLGAISGYFVSIANDLFKVLFAGWGRIFDFPEKQVLGEKTFIGYCLVCLLGFLLTALFLFLITKHKATPNQKVGIQLIVTGLIALILAGQPFWLTKSYLSFVFPNSRYTLPFLLGMSFFWTGILLLFPLRRQTVRISICLLLAIIIGLSSGSHFLIANEYRRDWTLTKDFFHQLKWRIPAIEENTVVITNQLPIRFSTDNSLTAPLNWIYAQDYEKNSMPYMLYTNVKREETLSKFEKGKKIYQEYLSAKFEGNTEDAISIYYNAPGCVHILDPEVDVLNQTIPVIDRDAALLNNYNRILTEVPYVPLDPVLFGEEPSKNWCWYYEHADLARQQKNWRLVAKLGDEALLLDDHPNDPMERLPFIEGYANNSEWDQAYWQTEEALKVTPVMNNPLCALWNRIQNETIHSNEKEVTIQNINQLLDCSFLDG